MMADTWCLEEVSQSTLFSTFTRSTSTSRTCTRSMGTGTGSGSGSGSDISSGSDVVCTIQCAKIQRA